MTENLNNSKDSDNSDTDKSVSVIFDSEEAKKSKIFEVINIGSDDEESISYERVYSNENKLPSQEEIDEFLKNKSMKDKNTAKNDIATSSRRRRRNVTTCPADYSIRIPILPFRRAHFLNPPFYPPPLIPIRTDPFPDITGMPYCTCYLNQNCEVHHKPLVIKKEKSTKQTKK